MRVQPLGDTALLIELGHAIDAATHARVRAAFDALSAAGISPGVRVGALSATRRDEACSVIRDAFLGIYS